MDYVFGDERLPDAFWSKCSVLADAWLTPCWIWTGAADSHGYGRYGRPTRLAHRVAYEALVGPIDQPHTDHLCRVPSCVNPAHLEPVSAYLNMIRGVSPLAVNALKTHCKYGHEFTPANTRVVNRRGRASSRECRECDRLKSSKRYYQNHEANKKQRREKYHTNKEVS